MNAADINYVERKEDEARELVNTVIERVQQVKEAVSKANSAADTAFTAANKLMKVASVIYNISAVFVRSAAEKFASVLHSLVKTARTETLIAEREVESAVQVTKLVEEAIQNLRSAALKASEKEKRSDVEPKMRTGVLEEKSTEECNTNTRNRTSKNDVTFPANVQITSPQTVDKKKNGERGVQK
ncbi:hypothetical protein LSM04_001708 [Trypanosoma melophagium]|uniref:uncharacterized protein n=1 Tax=Trypanosoma melophagium TaxID=715481 RepID=UPI00351A352A|nr:hypothetical protein LSM04_001708 [Trypanosoma melophagium]